MTIEQFRAFESKARELGYRIYPAPNNGDYALYKSFGESAYEKGRSNYQVCLEVYEWVSYDKYSMTDDTSYSIAPIVFVSRTIDERYDLELGSLKEDNIAEIEKLAESFYQWVEQNITI